MISITLPAPDNYFILEKMINLNNTLQPGDLSKKLKNFWQLSGEKIRLLEKNYDNAKGSPVFTV